MTSVNIDQIVRNEIQKIAERRGFEKYEFNLELTSDENLYTIEDKGKQLFVDIIIKGGNPPTIIIPMLFIARTFFSVKNKNIKYFQSRLERALEKVPRSTRTLSNNISRGFALILPEKKDRWKKSKDGIAIQTTIPDSYFAVEVMVKVTERLSGMSFTLAGEGKEYLDLVRAAKSRLSNIIINDESLTRFREMLIEMAEINQQLPKNVPTQTVLASDQPLVEVKEIIKYD